MRNLKSCCTSLPTYPCPPQPPAQCRQHGPTNLPRSRDGGCQQYWWSDSKRHQSDQYQWVFCTQTALQVPPNAQWAKPLPALGALLSALAFALTGSAGHSGRNILTQIPEKKCHRKVAKNLPYTNFSEFLSINALRQAEICLKTNSSLGRGIESFKHSSDKAKQKKKSKGFVYLPSSARMCQEFASIVKKTWLKHFQPVE